MIGLRVETEVDGPAARVWELLGDYRRDPEWRAGVTTMDPSPAGPAAPGQTTDEQMRFAGRAYRNGGRVESVGPGRTLSWRTTSGIDADGSRTVEELPGGRSRVRVQTNVRPDGVNRLLAPVLGVLLRRQLVGDLRRLRALVERATAG
ncbi:SRPBCC family protein [Pseudonocardia humida]|uniref:SRPBCC family protein n=1 Tax=Pseudonocardia humida TaxID=2800819 RepID=A0ABT1AB23_9PSEU|nr:SRPBCC family protein [Pseudonocardia humida]MCO1660237.1 SRPBCC family protein [Pseudonocardia humida]